MLAVNLFSRQATSFDESRVKVKPKHDHFNAWQLISIVRVVFIDRGVHERLQIQNLLLGAKIENEIYDAIFTTEGIATTVNLSFP